MLTVDRLREVLSYDPVRGKFLRKNGTITGSVHSKGYRRVVIGKKEYLEHRLVWFYVHGEWPAEQIDHINGNKADNRLENLRVCSNSENGQNRRRMRNNRAGYKGVSWHKGNRKWRAQITLLERDYFLGYFATPAEASDAYNQAALHYHGEFAQLDL